MRLEHDIKPVTQVKTRAAQLLKAVDETRRPIVITQKGVPKGVLLDFDTYQELRRATLMLKIVAQAEADIQAGRTSPQSQVLSGIRSRINRK